MTDDTVTLDLPGEGRRSALPVDAGLLLLAEEGGAPARSVVQLPLGPLVIGRDPPPGGLAIPQTSVSKLHARVSPGPNGYTIADLGSRNGIVVSGARVEEAVLTHGDLIHIGNALFKFLESGTAAFSSPAPAPEGFEEVVAGPSLAPILADLAVVARTDLTVLLGGETGTGKEVFARSVHVASRRKGRFVAVNCAAIPATLLEAELFGAKRGAFTGAERDREGLVRAADRGTLFLDEIGDMPPEAQAKMLRFIETKEVVPLGATSPERSDARLVCATHRDLAQLLTEGRFRGDLLARIRQHAVFLPPLRDRKEDIVPLLSHFLARAGRPDLKPDFRALVMLLYYGWPFNVRELEAAVRRAVALAKGSSLTERELPEDVRAHAKSYGASRERARAREAPGPGGPPPSSTASASQDVPDREELCAVLRRYGGNVTALARHYGKDRTQIHRWLRRHAIAPDDFR